ncbi:uncharacterized protein LOC108036458 [Drosophila biarmipes]|uniref:uncharacterized protein LOC108036458 n=1 Tax=Drosophila biarmipes TaxID=125945 RepID=UPI0007E71F0C|nr:uncharacterized protein LOC108036458 [Drosophila biarmipes]
MRILPIVLLTLIAVHSGGGKKQAKKAKDKGPCGKPFLKELNGKCYYVAHKKLNWFGAQNNCLRKGLNLADVSSQEDFNAVVHYVTVQVGMDDYWFGGNDLQSEGRFQYISSGKLVRYMGEHGMVEATHRSNMDDCLEIRIRPNRTVVLDVNCQEKKFFVCEQNQGKCAVPTADSSDANGQHHSHEHLHHFHHDAGKKEKQEAGGKKAHSVESDSRPADNSNSTEIGVSKEKEAEGTTAGSEGQTTPEASTAGEGETTPAEGESTAAPDAAASATPAEGATAAVPAPGAEATTAATAASAAEGAAAPETTPAPAA